MPAKRSTMDEGIAHLNAGRLAQAERCFRIAAQRELTPQVLNNWALCRRMAGDPADALAILQPLLAGPDPAPFTRALASRCYGDLGRRDDARRLLDLAIRDFESRRPDPAWTEYTAGIKQAAADLGDHRLVLELHKRWPGQNLGLGGHLGAVAAFNLGKYEQAIRYWERIDDRHWEQPKQAYMIAASLVQDGIAPPFQLEYDATAGAEAPEPTPAGLARAVAIGNVKAFYLAMMVTPDDEAERFAEMLVQYGGDWGADLGRRLLRAPFVPMPIKTAAARALTTCGIFQPGEQIPVVVEGNETRIVLKQTEIRLDSDPALDRLVAEARQLSRTGRRDEAIRILTELHMERGISYPPAMAALAEFFEADGRHAEARSYRNTLEKLRQSVRPAPQFDMVAMGDIAREEEEERPISPDRTLRTYLKGLPLQWLNAAAAAHGLPPARRRPEREQGLATALADLSHLQQVLAAEGPQVRQALRFLLEQGGVAKLSVLTRRFGAMAGDGFWWEERPPASPVGRLLCLALGFVGRMNLDGRRHKVVVVPAELRAALARCLTA